MATRGRIPGTVVVQITSNPIEWSFFCKCKKQIRQIAVSSVSIFESHKLMQVKEVGGFR
jgi:hypothetical protein